MDTQGRFSISAQALYSRLGTELAPIIVDIRRSPTFEADDTVIASAVRRLPAEVDDWRRELPEGRSVVVYCAHGQEVSQNAATTLRAAGTDACFLEHGITGWAELGLPRRRKLAAGSHGWVTRERPKIDRIACPWLIRRSSTARRGSCSRHRARLRRRRGDRGNGIRYPGRRAVFP